MGFKHFRLHCAVRTLMLVAVITLFVFLLTQTSLYASTCVVGFIILFQIWELIRYVDRSNRDLARFLMAVRHADFDQTFPDDGRGESFRTLRNTFNAILEEIHQNRREKHEHFRYLQTVVQHVGIGLIGVQPDGSIDLLNTAAKKLLRVAHLRSLADLPDECKDLVSNIESLRPGDKGLVKLTRQDETVQLALSATGLKLRDQSIKLVSLQNITSELAEREMEAWQQLVRVLTHEIMNSVTPISSLSATVRTMLGPSRNEPIQETSIDGDTLRDVRAAVDTIEKRSVGLMHFVEAYRDLSRIPAPDFQIFPVGDLFCRVAQLARARKDSRGLTVTTEVIPPGLELTADPELIEQVLLNLVINAVQALKDIENGKVKLAASLNDLGRVVVRVIDNGPGVDPQALDRLFVPFFSTKPGGTGIGLSLSRQIMRIHRGEISVSSEPNVHTSFSLRF